MAPRDPEVSISLQGNRAPTNRHRVSAVTTTISPCCKASIWGSNSCRAHQTSRVNTPTAELPDPAKYKISIGRFKNPQHGNQTPSTVFWPSLHCCQHMLCLPQAHCQFLSTVRLEGLHCTQREGQGQCGPARPQPIVGEAEGCQR